MNYLSCPLHRHCVGRATIQYRAVSEIWRIAETLVAEGEETGIAPLFWNVVEHDPEKNVLVVTVKLLSGEQAT